VTTALDGSGYTAAKERLDALVLHWQETGEENRNEATTRMHLIDELLTGALGWPRDQIVAEKSHEGEYADYTLGRPAARLILEAKREGSYFDLPAGVSSGVMSLKTVLDGSTSLRDAVDQVLIYCQKRGVPIATVCNGHQLVAFFASRSDGIPPLSGRALVFTSLEDMRRMYRLFWDNLSLPGVDSLTLHSTLGDTDATTPPEKLSARIAGYPGLWSRNKIQTELKILGDLVLQDILAAPELERQFLSRCYSSSNTLSKYALVSKEILEARYSALDGSDAGTTTAPARVGDEIAADLTSDVSAASLGKRPLILLGDVGVGKSIFIRHFMKIDAKDVMDKSVVLYINFGNEPALADDLNGYVLDRFIDQLREEHEIDIEADKFVRQVYKKELQSFKQGVQSRLAKSNPKKFVEKEVDLLERKLGKRDRHLQASLRYITRTQRRQVVVFLDNIDQRDFDFQEKVFLIGQSLAETWPATVFLSLRPDTFFRSREEGSLTAYLPRVFTISPPDIGKVITKRLKFCRQLVEDPKHRRQIVPEALDEQVQVLGKYLRIVEGSFRRDELVECVENLGGGNVRSALGFLNTFVGSGHVDTHKILRIAEESGTYTVPFHEFVRAIIYGDYEHYEPRASPIANIFEISSPDPREHFLLPAVLAHVERRGEVDHREGFLSMDAIMSFAQGLGFVPAQIEFAVKHAVRARLLQRSVRVGGESAAEYRITTVGAYTYRKLAGRFVYLDAIVVDTPIIDGSIADKLGDSRDIEDRLGRCRLFCRYLDEAWDRFDHPEAGFDWKEVRADLIADYERIERTLAKRAM
jgi:hypothetical protein